MSDAEPKWISTMSRGPEDANSQPSRVAVSEENLAGSSGYSKFGEPEAESLAEGAPADPVREGNESGNGVRAPVPIALRPSRSVTRCSRVPVARCSPP